MVVNKRKKVTKYRAHTTHGGGHRKKRRGAGNRGGRGKAGSGKRGKAKKPSSLPLGQKGFLPPGQKKDFRPVINLSSVSELIKSGQAKKEESGVYTLDLKALGYRKLLGTGEINLKLKVVVEAVSKQAKEKIEKAGGTVNLPLKGEK